MPSADGFPPTSSAPPPMESAYRSTIHDGELDGLPKPRTLRQQWWFVMGPAGTGKSMIGRALANALSANFVEGDDLHPPENIKKMRSCIPLTDDDRRPWLDNVARTCMLHLGLDPSVRKDDIVVTCSALKNAYRDRLRIAAAKVNASVSYTRADIHFVFLDAPRHVCEARAKSRRDHYMRPEMIRSQFNDLERPNLADEPDVIFVDALPEADVVCRNAVASARQARRDVLQKREQKVATE